MHVHDRVRENNCGVQCARYEMTCWKNRIRDCDDFPFCLNLNGRRVIRTMIATIYPYSCSAIAPLFPGPEFYVC